MKRVIVESPYAGNVELNLRYLRACLADSLARDEAPFASHGLYTQPGVLRDDTIAAQRDLGINAGFAWRQVAETTVVYTDIGITRGMRAGIEHAEALGHEVVYRSLGADWHDVILRKHGGCATHAWGCNVSDELTTLRHEVNRLREIVKAADLVHIRLRCALRESCAQLDEVYAQLETIYASLADAVEAVPAAREQVAQERRKVTEWKALVAV